MRKANKEIYIYQLEYMVDDAKTEKLFIEAVSIKQAITITEKLYKKWKINKWIKTYECVSVVGLTYYEYASILQKE